MFGGRRVVVARAAAAVAAVSLGAVVVQVQAPGPAARGEPIGLSGPLAVSGIRVVDTGDGGRPVVLQGVTVQAEAVGTTVGGFMDAGALTTVEDWGATDVRLQVSSDAVLHQCPGEVYDPAYGAELESVVSQLTSHGIFVIVGLGQTNPQCHWTAPQGSGIVPLPGDDATQALAVLAREFGANPLVGYEPFNEPQACALATSGPGAGLFVSSYGQGGACKSEDLAALAWSDPGIVTVPNTRVLGVPVTTFSYHTPGMNALYDTIMGNVPAGSPAPLVFMDANYFASDPATFDHLSGPLGGADNVVEVFHPYDCQDTSAVTSDMHQHANCTNPTPEWCATVNQRLQRYLVDPATGATPTRPVDFDEFNFPFGEHMYQYAGPLGVLVPILMYQHGSWVNNMIAAMQHQGVAGWDVFYIQNADVNDWDGPYSMFVPGITPSSPLPWAVTVNSAPVIAAMAGQTLSCQQPPLGFG